MSKKDIRKMTIKEILTKMGIMVFPDQILYILTDKECIEDIIERKDLRLTNEQVYSFIKDNPDKIDKERLVFITAMNLRDYLELAKSRNLSIKERGTLKNAEIRYENAKKLLTDCDVEIPVFDKENGRMEIKEFWTVNQTLLGKGKSKNQELLKERNSAIIKDLQNQGIIDILLDISSLNDFQDYLCYYPGNGKFLQYMINMNANNRCFSIVNEQDKELSDREQMEILLAECRIEYERVIEKYCDKFNMEKFLLVTAYRVRDILHTQSDLSVDEMQGLIKFMEYAEKHLQNSKLKIHQKVFLRSVEDKVEIEYSHKELQEDLSRVVQASDGKYYFSKKSLAFIKEKTLDGEYDFEKVNYRAIFDLLDFSTEEKNQLVELNPANFEHLVMLNALNREEIQEIIDHRLGDYKIGRDYLVYLYENRFIENSDIIKMYMQNHVELLNMVDFSFMYKNFDTEICIEELMEFYRKAKEEPEKGKDFDCYRLLFSEVRMRGKSPEQKSQIAGQIAMQICESESEYEDFKNFYHSNLLPMETLLEWNGEEIIYDLIQNGRLKPRDAKKLLIEGKLDIEKACYVLKTSNLSDEEKLNFIFSSFNGAGKNEEQIQAQNDARMYLIQALNVSNEMVQGQKSTTTRTKSKATGKSEGNHYVTDPIYRWQLFFEFDEDCEIELYLDGTAKVSLPKLDKIIFEKLFKSTKAGTKINYGAATYMMEPEEFYQNQNKIVQDGKVNRTFLVEMGEKEKADRFVHSLKWGSALKENLQISLENGYSEEKINRIDKLVDQIEKARELTD